MVVYGNFKTAAFTMLGEVCSRTGSSFQVDIWQSTIQVFASLLHCLHLVLMDPKGSISEHVSGFVASLQIFFVYGLTGGAQLMSAAVGCKEKEPGSLNLKFTSEEPKRTNNAPYRPPHLHKKDGLNTRQSKAQDPQSSSDHDSSMFKPGFVTLLTLFDANYGKPFPDIVQGLEHVAENLGSDQISVPSSFKYGIALEKQLTATMLHVLSLASATDHQPLKDFLSNIFSGGLGETTAQPEIESDSIGNQKKEMISKAIQSFIDVYEGKNQHSISQKFKKLDSRIS
ncbi:hypothetical protein CRYUN_Cryun13aG0098100 [Craigia yunnanensis]